MKSIFVIGAGPAGIFASQKLAQAGHQVFLFNRDIKPGGQAEYGIYPMKYEIKALWRHQFESALGMPELHYFGHVKVGAKSGLTLEDLRSLGPDAILVACGAQGYHSLGVPGESARGVYSAKDFVYHYNQLPLLASTDFSVGHRVAIIGMGNVAADIMRWLLEDGRSEKIEEVIVLARRGPLEAKFDEEEIEHVENYIDRSQFLSELDRVRSRCTACGQDISPENLIDGPFPFLAKEPPALPWPRLSFRFLTSLKDIVPGSDGRVRKIVVTENDLVTRKDGSVGAKGTEHTSSIKVDTVIFAIGDSHDPEIGLPMGPKGYATAPNPDSPDQEVYQVWDPAANAALTGIYVAGWARQASTGLVGVAQRDGRKAADQILAYLGQSPDKPALTVEQVESFLVQRGVRSVNNAELQTLARAESWEAKTRKLEYFKYSDDDAMFNAIALETEHPKEATEVLVS